MVMILYSCVYSDVFEGKSYFKDDERSNTWLLLKLCVSFMPSAISCHVVSLQIIPVHFLSCLTFKKVEKQASISLTFYLNG